MHANPPQELALAGSPVGASRSAKCFTERLSPFHHVWQAQTKVVPSATANYDREAACTKDTTLG
ncbi:unnamed protein product [Clonostachys chloroleuca]|uniref:Uncharacterized protein n=1 Tax=Clonostachys chloroleuca TaxID=1926264 RepID=A0AA35M6T8_9HYPO|nr:unnamed protein product [Clonostachys chloroleuca]CAI6089205.1 unnamed protein product [Clonostachys chloroleuca]CAI6091513.1 unnamed protein product [Clonostachys chloroleuca]